jgi:hypothetical protein
MKKVYECSLLQVTSEQGYIVSGEKNLTEADARNLYYPYGQNDKDIKKDSDVYFGQLLVTKTLSKYFAKEIRTGKLLPVIQGIHVLDYNKGEYKYQSFPFGKIHTYISSIRHKDTFIKQSQYYGLEEVYDKEVIDGYLKLHLDKVKFEQEIDAFYRQGEIKMENKIEKERLEEKNDANHFHN